MLFVYKCKTMKTLYKDTSSIHGAGLHIKEGAKKGEKIAYIQGDTHVFRSFNPEISKRMIDWIGVGRYTWIDTSKSMFRFINHSCDPNVVIVGQRTVIAFKDIPPESEITMDYSITEAEPGWKLENCNCGTKLCRGTVLPIYKLKRSAYSRYLPHIPKNFQKIYKIENG